MDAEHEPRTRASLLVRLGNDPLDQAAWGEFVQWYGPKIHAWCRHYGLQPADAQDVTQTVLLKLAVKMKSFRYDPNRSFRAWLKTLTHNAWYQLVTSRKLATLSPGTDSARHQLASIEARDDLVNRLEEHFNLELLEEITEHVRQRVSPRTWEAFRLLVYEEVAGAEAARRLGMKIASVYVAKSRVQKLLRDEIRLREEMGS